MDLPTFLLQFPEFGSVPDPQLIQFLAASASRIDPSVFGAQFDQANGYLAAHMLVCSPYGQSARMESKSGPDGEQSSTYYYEYKRILRAVTVGRGRIA